MIPKRVVLDTNVCLDLFVFRDPRWATLEAALRSGAIEAVTRTDCRMEWLAVLQYEHLPLDESSRAEAAIEFDAVIRCVEDTTAVPPGIRLPLCSDPDDQKFLETALAQQAGILITKDKALLKLARKTARAGLFRILPPQDWRLEE
ncbi:MAG TPA: putative toxin-antitoxin system toxin component, PIN family [Noviherbaspirillum sp.]|jgi:putative PIN family toxin of toxin-antitoxin system|uniref:putative toxin-antitoxin system toxin component, PIN family n=1 Tax=Noviherbaspirillum sp. TaxID=1926288 RepID=UPI002DDD2148|nr:putative toxin-antitoxin system toxin component, PIN family [Noviherbaspirillum sp.]HEV2611413.1 putative toxin-antitoxin system toxin component, PIN family [Noviherbaspirillum sp.]